MLRDDTRWAEVKAWEEACNAEGQDYPLAFVDHVDELLMEEIDVVVARAMGTSVECVEELLFRPWWCFESDRGTMLLKMVQQLVGRMGQRTSVGKVVTWTARANKSRPTHGLNKLCISGNVLT